MCWWRDRLRTVCACQATEALDALRPSGSTNLWAGLRTGMDSLRAGVTAGAAHQDRKVGVAPLPLPLPAPPCSRPTR